MGGSDRCSARCGGIGAAAMGSCLLQRRSAATKVRRQPYKHHGYNVYI